MAACPHFSTIFDQHYKEAVLREGLRTRLTPDCLFVGCGRRDNGHALHHFATKSNNNCTGHAVALDLSCSAVWCYVCDDYVAGGRDAFSWLDRAGSTKATASGATLYSPKKLKGSSLAGVAGLQNLGNTCYMNAALQVMLNCPPIRSYFADCSQFVLNRPHRDISGSFLELHDSVCAQRGHGAVHPRSIVRAIKTVNPMFEGFSQQDTMDFMRCLWDRLHEELMDPVPAASGSSKAALRRSDRLACPPPPGPNYTPYIPKSRSVVSHTFGGILRSQVDCLSCKNVFVKEDPFFDLSLPIALSSSSGSSLTSTTTTSSSGQSTTAGSQKSPTLEYMGSFFSSIGESLGFPGKTAKLESCLAAFCTPEALEGRDRYYCETCKAKVSSLKTLSIQELPNVLCIQLKRFKHESFFSSKVNTHVAFPVDRLDMSPFVAADAPSQAAADTSYELISVINHLGSFGGGHYTAFCRHPESGRWLKFDDSCVCEARLEDIQSSQAYCLVYRRAFKARQQPPPPPRLLDPPNVLVSRQWCARWKHLAVPGPVDSSDLLCPHSRLSPEIVHSPEQIPSLTVGLTDAVLGDLESRFGTFPGTASAVRLPTEVCTVCKQEAMELEHRRRQESAAITELDTRQVNAAEGEQWHLIEMNWLVEFLAFRDGKQKGPPGPITNNRLVDEHGHPKRGLKRGVHYRAVNPQVWSYLHGRYGGGPVIRKDSVDIYSPAGPTPPIEIIVSKQQQEDDHSSMDGDSPRRTSPRRTPQ